MITYPELLIQPDGSLNHDEYPILARVVEARRRIATPKDALDPEMTTK